MKHPVLPKKSKNYIAGETIETSPPFRTPPHENQEHPGFPPEHQHCLLPGRGKCGDCVYKDILLQKYQKKVKYLVG